MPTPPASLASLLAELHQKQRVLGGWAAVLSLSESSVQRLVAAQWPAAAQLSVEWAEAKESGGSGVDFKLATPTFELAGDGAAITFRQAVTAATLRGGAGPAAANEISLPDDAAIEGTIALQLSTAAGASQNSLVALDLAHATVTLRGLEGINLSSNLLAARVVSALAGNRPLPPLAVLDLTPGPEQSALQPASLQYHVTATPSGARVLQLFIGGPGGAPSTTSIDVSEPVPTADGCDYCLLVDSTAVIQDIVAGFNAQTGLVKLVAVDSEANTAAYAQTRSPMQFRGTISCGKAITPIQSSASMGMNFKGTPTDGLTVSGYPLPGGTITLQLAVAGNFPVQVSAGDLALSAQATSVTATGVAENTVKPRLESFLRDDISPNLSKVSLTGPRELLLRRLSLPGLLPVIDHAQIPADFVLAGTLADRPTA